MSNQDANTIDFLYLDWEKFLYEEQRELTFLRFEFEIHLLQTV